MDLFDLVAKITLDSSEYERGIKKAGGGASSFSAKWSKAGKVIVAGIGAAATAVGMFTKKSVESYAEYEQLVGGVRKLYGDSADEMLKYAEQGYKTAGMSANKYMELATSFSAALINSFDGDTAAAAKQTDVAMRAISDNWNTFGGDITNIQNAFQGFSKQNYTMLDNLKLGYGGTKTEMERLISDANEYAKSIGLAGDLSINSFGDIVTAIDLVQQKQGIAGTTAKEAATTISGAFNMTKAAWENLLTGFADPEADVGQLMDNLVVAIVGDKEGEGLLNQLIPAVERAVEGIGKFVEAAVPALAEKLPSLISTFLPVIIKSLITLITSLAQALPSVITTVLDMLPTIIDMVINGLVDAIAQALPIIIKQGPKIVMSLIKGIFSALKTIGSAGKRLIEVLDSAIYGALSALGKKVISYAKKIPSGIKQGLGTLASIGRNLIEGLWGGIKAKFDGVIEKVKGLARKLPTAVKKVLGISSPSKVFMEVGKWIPEGLALGIEKNVGSVQDAADAMADATAFVPDTEFSLSGGSDYADSLLKALSSIKVEVVTNLDGKEVARITAPLMSDELNKLQMRANRKLGYV